MFKTFTNLQTHFPLIINTVTLVNNNKEYICYQVDFNSLEDKESFGRVLLKLVLRNFTSNVNIVLEKLRLTSIDNLNELLKDGNEESGPREKGGEEGFRKEDRYQENFQKRRSLNFKGE